MNRDDEYNIDNKSGQGQEDELTSRETEQEISCVTTLLSDMECALDLPPTNTCNAPQFGILLLTWAELSDGDGDGIHS